MKTVIVISFTNLAKDPRVNRQIRWLSRSHRVIAIGTADPNVEGVEFVACPREPKSPIEKVLALTYLLTKQRESFYWLSKQHRHCLEILRNHRADLIIANDVEALPVALRGSNGSRVLFDAHEFSPRQFEDRIAWRILYQDYVRYLCARYLQQADHMITVCQGIADEYGRCFGVQPDIITNAPDYGAINPSATSADRIRLIHHGVATPSRRIEIMIEMMDHLDSRFELDLMLVPSLGDERYLQRLKRLAAKQPRIHFVPPVPMRDIVRHISSYDIGLAIFKPVNFNLQMVLPNKFFEYIQAGLGICIGPSVEMANIIRENGCGIIAEDFSPKSIAKCLSNLDQAQVIDFKRCSAMIAERYSAQVNEERFTGIVRGLLDSIPQPSGAD